MRVLFVCTGNTCRSPIAEALFKDKVRKLQIDQQKSGEIQFEVASAGIRKFKNIPVSRHTITVLADYNIQCDHIPQGLNQQLVTWADLILTMTNFHKFMVLARFPDTQHQIFTLKEFVGERDNVNIKDPVGKSLSDYRQCAEEINQALDLLLLELLKVGNQNLASLRSQTLPGGFQVLLWLLRRINL